MRALVVDDSKTMRKILTRILNTVGFDVVLEAGDGVAGLEQLRASERPDLVLVDWNMPYMDGYQFVRTVRLNRDYDDVPLVMVTTESETERVVAALEIGANEYVMKPFTPDVILGKLEMLGVIGVPV